MADEIIRSEKPSLQSLSETLAAIKTARDPGDLAQLLMLATELYADAQCRCEEKVASFGEGDDEGKICYIGVNKGRDEMLAMFQEVVQCVTK